MSAPGSAAATAFQGSSALWAEPLTLGGLGEAYTAVVEPLDRALKQMAKTTRQPQATGRVEIYSISFDSACCILSKLCVEWSQVQHYKGLQYGLCDCCTDVAN